MAGSLGSLLFRCLRVESSSSSYQSGQPKSQGWTLTYLRSDSRCWINQAVASCTDSKLGPLPRRSVVNVFCFKKSTHQSGGISWSIYITFLRKHSEGFSDLAVVFQMFLCEKVSSFQCPAVWHSSTQLLEPWFPMRSDASHVASFDKNTHPVSKQEWFGEWPPKNTKLWQIMCKGQKNCYLAIVNSTPRCPNIQWKQQAPLNQLWRIQSISP